MPPSDGIFPTAARGTVCRSEEDGPRAGLGWTGPSEFALACHGEEAHRADAAIQILLLLNGGVRGLPFDGFDKLTVGRLRALSKVERRPLLLVEGITHAADRFPSGG